MKRFAVCFVCLVVLLGLQAWGAAAAPKKRTLGAVVGPVRLIPRGGEPIVVSDLHAYAGTIELSSAADGIVVSNVLPLERYLLGLNEVPSDWPIEALRAQAVAARTYALNTLARPPAGAAATYGFDICASVECQVYSGIDTLTSPTGWRWIEAVASTEGRAILYEGEPILARYHSTSGGRTLDNPDAFPDEPDYPYLRSVTSKTEGGSPLYRWRVRFTLRVLEKILVKGDLWRKDLGPLRDVRTIPSERGEHDPDVALDGKGGLELVDAADLRVVAREQAPALFPARYPSASTTSSGTLPETLPSHRFDVETRGRTVVFDGRGWGHGVGMSQWGGEGLARAGASYVEILEHYYTGVDVEAFPDPGEIEVGVGWGRPSAVASGAFALVDGRGKILVNEALGTWRFLWAGPGAVRIDPPEGFGLPLRIGVVEAPSEAEMGELVAIDVALSRPARVSAATSPRPKGYERVPSRIHEAGRRTVYWRAPDEPGAYRVRIEADSGRSTRKSEPVRIEVAARPPAAASGAPVSEEGGPSSTTLVLLGAIVLVAAVFGLLTVTIRK